MDSEELQYSFDYLAGGGHLLSIEEKSTLQNTLLVLKAQQKFHKVFFWGKIFGIQETYCIAQGYVDDALKSRRTFYSKDCLTWAQMTPATDDMKGRALKIHTRFTGDPSYEFEQTDMKPSEIEDGFEEEETISIKEEDRLSAVIAEIDEQTSVIPKGAYILTPNGRVIANRVFEGLDSSEAGNLSNYLHFRLPLKIFEKHVPVFAQYERSICFLDSLEDDIPEGSWSLQYERGNAVVILRSLMWPGYTFFHKVGINRFGGTYYGIGQPNLDITFMLPDKAAGD